MSLTFIGGAQGVQSNTLSPPLHYQQSRLGMNVLFICNRNQWQSPTVEQVFRHYPKLAARSAGTSRSAGKTVNHELLS